ncbi:MAG TPA: MFS transporter, partial [Baekduia sp.]
VGNSMGVAVIGATTTAAVAGSLHDGLASASHTGWWIIVGCGVTVLALGLASTTRWAHETAARTAAGLIDHPLRRVAA